MNILFEGFNSFCTCAESFYNFCFLVGEKISLLFWNYLLILQILPVTRFNDPKAMIDFDTENAYSKPPVTS